MAFRPLAQGNSSRHRGAASVAPTFVAALRREIEPVDQQAYARFLLGWHSIPSGRQGLDGLVEALGQLQGVALVASTVEAEVLPARLRSFRAADLDELCTAGELVWIGAGGLGANDGRIRFCFADQLPVLALGWENQPRPEGAVHDVRPFLANGVLNEVRVAPPETSDTELPTAPGLGVAGEVTNDPLAPLRC